MTSRWSMCRRTRVQAADAFPGAIVAMVLVATGLAGCAPVAPVAPEPTVRVIVRFSPEVVDPLDPAFLTRLADLSQVARIDAIRPMSGAAYVLQLACTDPRASAQVADPCASAIARVGRSKVVLGIEVDRREKHQ